MTLKKLFLTILISAVFSVLPFNALAASCDLPNCAEYITYGGYDVIEKAFSSIALIFSDNRTGALVSGTYAWLYFSLFIIGVVFIFTNGKFAAITGHTQNIYEWIATFWWAIVFYVVLIFPMGTVIVRDESMNKDKTIQNVPVGIVIVAGLTNGIEVGLKNVIETAMSPLLNYTLAGNGVGFDMFGYIYSVAPNIKFKSEYDRMNLGEYLEDCVSHGILTGDVSVEEVKKNSDFMTGVLANANYTAVYTLRYDDTNKQGAEVSCAAAYTSLQSTFTASYWDDMFKDICKEWGFTTPLELTQCRTIADSYISNILNAPTVSSGIFMQQAVIASELNKVILSGSSSQTIRAVGARDTGTGMAGAGILANQFIPIFRNVIMAITIAMSPIVMLFMSIWGIHAFRHWIGGFIWVALWGVTDVILNSFAMDYAYDVFEQIRKNELGFGSLFLFDTASTKTLAVMGYMRTFGAMLSMSLVSGIMQFGSYALAQVAGSMQGKMEGAGHSAGKTGMQVEGQSAKLKELEASMSAMPNFREFDFNTRTQAGTFQQARGYEGATQSMKALGGGAFGAAHRTGGMDAFNTERGVVSTEALRDMGHDPGRLGHADALNQAITTEAAEKKVKELGGVGKAVNMISDSQARGDVDKAKETAHLIAAYGGMTNLTDQEAMSYALRAGEGIEKANTHYKELGKTLGYGDSSTGMMQAVKTESQWHGAKSAAESGAVLEPGARAMMAQEIGKGVTGSDIERYNDLRRGAKNIDEFRDAVKHDEKLQAVDEYMTGGKEDATLLERAVNYDRGMAKNRSDLAAQMGGYAGDTKTGEHLQLLKRLDAWGLGRSDYAMQQLAQAESSSNLNEAMATAADKAYSEKLGRPVTFFSDGVKNGGIKVPNMKIRDAVTPDGGLNITTAEATYGGFNYKWSNGVVTKEGTFDEYGALKRAHELHKEGHGYAAHGLSGLVSREGAERLAKEFEGTGEKEKSQEMRNYIKEFSGHFAEPGTGVTSGEAVHYREVMSQDGKSATFHAKHGARTDWENLETRTKGSEKEQIERDTVTVDRGRRERVGNDIVRGNKEIEQDIRKNVTDHGFQLNNAMWMAMAGDSSYAKYVSKPSKEFDANVAKTVDSTLDDVRDFLKREGVSVGFARGEAGVSAGFRLFGIGADAKGNVGRGSEEREAVDLVRGGLDRTIRGATTEAWAKGMTEEQTQKLITQAAGNYIRENIYDPARKATSKDYGGDAPITAVKNSFQNPVSDERYNRGTPLNKQPK